MLYLTSDGGTTFLRSKTFDRVLASLTDATHSVYARSVALDTKAGRIAVAVNNLVLLSEDHGRTWRPRGESPAPADQLVFGPRSRLLFTTSHGLVCSPDLARHWYPRCP